ncbi:MAG: aminopeptidase [Clostridia bacterium]|nr:aminopeptidase [Clostridia bacterium]
MKKLFLSPMIALILCAALLLGGCASPAPAKAPELSDAPVPTALLAPTPVPTPAPTPVPAESEYYRDSRMLAYADHIAGAGLNIQPGEEVLISAPVYTSELVDLVAEACYARGACAVNVVYGDTARNYSAMRHLKDKDYSELVFDSTLASWLSGENSSVCYLSIISPRFDLERPDAAAREQYSEAAKKFLYSIKDWDKSEFPPDKRWCVAACVNPSWAKKVYPDQSDAEAISMLWEDIFSFVYLDKTATTASIAAVRRSELDERAAILTEMGIESLHFVGGDTDITVRLHQPHRFQGPTTVDAHGEETLPNIPCEECFTMPEKTGVNGTVAASRPLVLSNGTVIEDLRMTFVDGRLTEYAASTNEEAFAALLEEESMRYLGEVALVSANSPIYATGRVYYTTLFDENATCHMAIGHAYPDFNLPAGTEPDEQVNAGDNHIDFMFGTDDMAITATLLDGTQRPIFQNGVWAF